MASFQAKIGWKRPRKKKIKIIVSFRSYTTRNRKFQKNSKKIQKVKNIIMASFQEKIGWKTQGKRENKNCRFDLFHSYPTRNKKIQKNSKKIQQYHFGIISSQNRLENAEKERM